MSFHLSSLLPFPNDAPLDDPRRQGDYERQILQEWPGERGEQLITEARASKKPLSTLLFILVDHSDQKCYRQMRANNQPDFYEMDDEAGHSWRTLVYDPAIRVRRCSP